MLGATNRVDMLDAALLRPGRFDEVLAVLPPDEAAREQILRIHTKGMPLDLGVHLGGLAGAPTAGWSGAQLASLCREAAMGALRESLAGAPGAASRAAATPEVSQRHLEAALARVHAGSC